MANGDRVVTHDDLFHHEPEDFLAFRDLQGLGAFAQACPEVSERLDQAQVRVSPSNGMRTMPSVANAVLANTIRGL